MSRASHRVVGEQAIESNDVDSTKLDKLQVEGAFSMATLGLEQAKKRLPLKHELSKGHRKVQVFSDKEKPVFKIFKKKNISKHQIEQALALGIDPYLVYQDALEAHYASYQQELEEYTAKVEGKAQNNEVLARSLRQVVKENEKLKKNVNALKSKVKFCQTEQHMFDLMDHHQAGKEAKGVAKTSKQKASRKSLSDDDQLGEPKLMQRTMFPPCS